MSKRCTIFIFPAATLQEFGFPLACLSAPVLSLSLFFLPSLFHSAHLSFSVSALPPVHFNVTSWWPPGSESDGRASCMELLEALAPQATSVMEVSRNHRSSKAKIKRTFFPCIKGCQLSCFVKFNGIKKKTYIQ